MPSVVSLYRYPVKGLSAQPLDSVDLRAGETIPFDRAYAIEDGPSFFDPDNPKFLPKVCFLTLMRHERLAALKTEFDEASETLTIFRRGKQVARGRLNTLIGRQILEEFFAAYMKGELKGPPHIVFAPGHSFSDKAAKCVHFVNLATVRDVERITGAALDPLRFRANVYFDGAEAWEERRWVGREIRAGGAVFEVFAETVRCDGTNVNPATAQRDTSIPPELVRTFGNANLGFYATVKTGGKAARGDPLEVL